MPSRHAVFHTERLLIRTATEKDVALLYEMWTDPRVMTNVGFPHGLRITRAKIEQQVRRPYDSEFDRVLMVVLAATGEAIGECGMHTPDDEGLAELDVKLLPAFWGHKYGTEACRGLVDYLFSHTPCKTVGTSPNAANIASIKMIESAGGVRVDEQTYEFPEAMRDYTTPVHCYIYHVYREDWEQQRSNS